MPATGRRDRHACVHHRHRAAADRRHRRRAVGLEDVRDEADRVGELLFGGNDRRERALGEGAVPDLAAARSALTAGLADREGREVVVEHEAPVLLAGDVLDLLLVVGRAERAADQRLRLAAGEDDRAVHAREDAGLRPDRTDLVELPAVEAHAALERLVAHRLFLEARGRCAPRPSSVARHPRAETPGRSSSTASTCP